MECSYWPFHRAPTGSKDWEGGCQGQGRVSSELCLNTFLCHKQTPRRIFSKEGWSAGKDTAVVCVDRKEILSAGECGYV